MAHRPPTHWLAPIAIATVAVAGYGVLAANRPDEGDGGAASRSGSSGQRDQTRSARRSATTRRGPKRYTVRAGDTLSGIAARTGVSVSRITELNPGLDAQALQPGQQLKLRS